MCWTCHKNNNIILKSQNKPALGNSTVLQEQLEHLSLAHVGIQYYRSQCQLATKSAVSFPSAFEKHLPCSFDGVAHYSWDYAQQLHYPHDPFQPGPIFFKTPRKCGIFGVCNDGINMQYNYFVDEINSTGKGATATISYIHHFLNEYGFGEKTGYFNADNCSGKIVSVYTFFQLENKYYFVIEYLDIVGDK